MSANVELADLVGGLELNYTADRKQINVNRDKNLIQKIENGGIFVLDEAAMSQQAKEVISWFSELTQKRPGQTIQLQDIPGHTRELTIHPDFHLVITGNDPKTTLGRKELPKEVSHFVEKIIYPETAEEADMIGIAKKMVFNLTGHSNNDFAERLARIHLNISQKIKLTKREMQKVVQILKDKIKSNQLTD